MTTAVEFKLTDLFRFNTINLDSLTETYNNSFYAHYLACWPEYQTILEHPDGQPMGYILGKVEGKQENWHGHVTAVTVAPQCRRIGIATRLMKLLEDISEHQHGGYFVDLYVRASNSVATRMYNKMGYIIYRRVLNYYTGHDAEDAFDMRKALPRDVEQKSIQTTPTPTNKPQHLY